MSDPAKKELWRMGALGVGGSALAFLLFGGLSAINAKGSSDPYDAMPRGSFIVATVDVEELRRSPLYEAVFGQDTPGREPLRSALGMGSLADACGFDPLARVRKLAVSLPEEGERGDFGLAARVDVSREELERCTRALSEKRGDGAGKLETKEVGSFVVASGGGDDGAGGRHTASLRPRLGYGRAGVLVVGKGSWFDAMLAAADHQAPGARDNAEHAALRASLTSRDGFRAPTLLVTAILPRALRERLKGEMGAEASAEDRASATMAGVLGVSAAGVALHAGDRGGSTDAAVELVCDTPAGCEAVEKLVLKKRRDWSRELTLRMVGLGPLLDSFEVKRDGTRLRASASSSASALAATVERILKLRARAGSGPEPPPTGARRDLPPPDESIGGKPPATAPDAGDAGRPDGDAGGARSAAPR